MIRKLLFIFALSTAVVAIADEGIHNPLIKFIPVNCDFGQSLAKFAKHARENQTLLVTGVCHESVTITKDGITLKGENATLSGELFDEPADVLTIDGAQRVKIIGFNIKQGKNGIVASGGANVSVSDSIVTDSSLHGIHAEGSSFFNLKNVAISGSGANGLNLQQGSDANVTGNLTVAKVGTFGINVQDSGNFSATDASLNINENTFGVQFALGVSATLTGTTLNTSNNFLIGTTVDSGTSLFLFNSHIISNSNTLLDGFSTNTNANVDLDKDSSITANNNGRDGFNIENGLLNLFVFFTPTGPKLEAINNKGHGMLLINESKLDMVGLSSLVLENNVLQGLKLEDGSAANIYNAKIINNGDTDTPDISLEFATRANFVAGNTPIGTIVCDGSSFIKGEVSCP